MIRTILTPEKQRLTLELPEDFLGKQIEVIAFIVEEAIVKSTKKVGFTILDVAEEHKKNYTFNRDEANER